MRVLLYTDTIDRLYRKAGNIGGIAIQMSFWAETFKKKGCEVFSLSREEKGEKNGIKFLYIPYRKYINIFLEFIYTVLYLVKLHPDVIIYRGCDRNVAPLALLSHIFGCKFIYFCASDTDFEPGKEIIPNERDRKIFRYGMRHVKYVVVQNNKQETLLQKNYGTKKYCIIPNIWIKKGKEENASKDIDFIWVSRIVGLKRPEWFINLAQDYPQYNFVMIGGSCDEVLMHQCAERASKVNNLKILGEKQFEEVNQYVAKAKCLVCTSEFEGFPNTFLQAWSNGIPVISTVDPSNLITTKNLGIFSEDYSGIKEAAKTIMENSDIYNSIQKNIISYFDGAHNPEIRYEEVIKLISDKE